MRTGHERSSGLPGPEQGAREQDVLVAHTGWLSFIASSAATFSLAIAKGMRASPRRRLCPDAGASALPSAGTRVTA